MTETDLVDACVNYIEMRTQSTTTAEAIRNADNAVKYICFGDEKALANLTLSGFINEDVLRYVVEWAELEGYDSKASTCGHLEILREYLQD